MTTTITIFLGCDSIEINLVTQLLGQRTKNQKFYQMEILQLVKVKVFSKLNTLDL